MTDDGETAFELVEEEEEEDQWTLTLVIVTNIGMRISIFNSTDDEVPCV